jgi:hypothetical protein
LVLAACSATAPTNAPAVVLTISAKTRDIVVFRSSPLVDMVALAPSPPDVDASQLVEMGRETWLPVGRAWNQLLEKSKKHRSDQLQEVRKRIRRRNEQ